MSFRRRAYPELVDNILTRLIGGVAAESYPFPPATKPPFKHPLERPPVRTITSVYGLRNGESVQFKNGVDFELQDNQVLVWKENGGVPDKGSTFQVNYIGGKSAGPVTDIQVGSVARTLLEAAALEMAGLYAQMELVYQSGFVDTAQGSALDQVVALLGIDRVLAGRNSVTLEFRRAAGTRGDIFIPALTRVLTADGAIEYETTQAVTLVDGQTVVKVGARDTVDANDPVPAGALVLIAKTISGIDSVSNSEPSTVTASDEADTDLRTRAKSFLHGSERGTLAAIRQAIARENVLADVSESAPGIVNIIFHGDDFTPEQKLRIERAVDEVRPAGILMNYSYAASPQAVDIEIRLTTQKGLLEEDLRRIQGDIKNKIADYFRKLEVKATGSINRIVGAALETAGVEDVRILGATVEGNDVLDRESGVLAIGGAPTVLGELIITDPNLPTLLQVSVRFPKNIAAPDKTAITAALNADIAYLNQLNAVELPPSAGLAELAKRQLSFGRLALSLPLPAKTTLGMANYDAAVATGTAPTLPGIEALGNYSVQWTFISETGLGTIIDTTDSPMYVLSDFERLSLGGVEVQVTQAVEV